MMRGEQSPPCGLRTALLRGVGARMLTVAVRPGLALLNHPRAQVFAIQIELREQSAVVVVKLPMNDDLPAQRLALEHVTRGASAHLADLRRVDAMNANADRLAARRRPDPDRVTVHHMRHHARPFCLARRECQRRGTAQDQQSFAQPCPRFFSVSGIKCLHVLLN